MNHLKETGLTGRARQDELLKVAEQAAAWLIELEDGGARERVACAAWLEESPLHVEMFLRAGSVDRLTELMVPEDVKALAQKDWGSDHAVVELRGSPARPVIGRPPAPAKRFVAIAAAMLVLVTGAVWYELFGPGAWDSYRTQIGEQRVVSLADGSVIYVNTDSQIDVRYSKTGRDVRLRSGEALFNVERDAHRPFQVHVGDTIVRAVGTQFNVYRRSGGTKVAVVEGVVQVSRGGEAAAVVEQPGAGQQTDAERLTAGQGVSLSQNGAIAKPVTVNVSQVTAWRQRRLVFEWQTLDEIAVEFNRYNRTPQIKVEGADVGMRRYTAVFDADNPQTLLRFLSRDETLKFAADGNDFVIRAR